MDLTGEGGLIYDFDEYFLLLYYYFLGIIGFLGVIL